MISLLIVLTLGILGLLSGVVLLCLDGLALPAAVAQCGALVVILAASAWFEQHSRGAARFNRAVAR